MKTRKAVESNLGWKVNAASGIIDRVALLDGFCAPFAAVSAGTIGLEDCERPPTHLRNKKAIAEKNLARHFPGTRKSPDNNELANVHSLLGMEHPADGLGKVKSDMVPLLRML